MVSNMAKAILVLLIAAGIATVINSLRTPTEPEYPAEEEYESLEEYICSRVHYYNWTSWKYKEITCWNLKILSGWEEHLKAGHDCVCIEAL